MKKILSTLCLMAFLAVSAQAQVTFTIKGQLADKKVKELVKFGSIRPSAAYDSVMTKKGAFTLKVTVPQKDFCMLTGAGLEEVIYADGTDYTLKQQKDGTIEVVASKTNQGLHEVYSAVGQMNKKPRELAVVLKEKMEANMDNMVPAFILGYYRKIFDFNYQKDVVSRYHAADDTRLMQMVRKQMEQASRTEAGAKAPEFTLSDPEGNEHSLKEYLGKGYILLDFWASWCGPCRQEMPTVKKAYEQYKDRGLQIIGISLDDRRPNWEKALKELELPWAQLSDLQGFKCTAAREFNVNSIPAIFLLDKNGTIVARGLRGSSLLEKLEEVLK